MRFVLDESSWGLTNLHPVEWHFLCELPKIAAGEGFEKSLQSRLLPDPLIVPESERDEHAEFDSDWEEFVKPDLELSFQGARERVVADLETATTDEKTEGDDLDLEESTYRSLTIPIEHTEAWYNALNQARIILNEAHDIANSEDRFSAMFGDSEGIDPDEALVLAEYEFYSVVQSILVENVMLP